MELTTGTSVFIISTFITTVVCQGSVRVLNTRPIIGVLVQEANVGFSKFGRDILPASYVKYIEASGGRVAPILVGQLEEYYEKMFYSVNGLLMTGGWVSITDSGYARSARLMVNLAKESNKRGDVFPVWGTCLGFETLSYLLGGEDVLDLCETWDMVGPLNFTKGFHDSQLFKDMPQDMIRDMATMPIAINYHHHCVTVEKFYQHGFEKHIKLLSINTDYNGTEFASTFEAIGYPFFGTQWHPEKILFEFVPGHKRLENIPHFPRAIQIAQYLSRFFIDYARQSRHRFPTIEEENSVLIYNYQTTFSALQCSIYEQVYIITPHWFSRTVVILLVLTTITLIGFYVFLWRKGRCVSMCCSAYSPPRK